MQPQQFALEEVRGGVVGAQPGGVAQEAVDFVGNEQLLEIDSQPAKRSGQLDGLREIDVAAVVAVDQLYRR